MTAPKLTEAQREALEHYSQGSSTTDPRARLDVLHALARKGLVTYEQSESYRHVFGVIAYTVTITDAGRAALKGEGT